MELLSSFMPLIISLYRILDLILISEDTCIIITATALETLRTIDYSIHIIENILYFNTFLL